MTTTSATAGGARFIGRVGALAVALGIGVAVVNSPAIASADTGGTDSSGTTSGAASEGSKADTSTPNRGRLSAQQPAAWRRRCSNTVSAASRVSG